MPALSREADILSASKVNGMPSSLQIAIERQRAIYEALDEPLLYQLAKIHRLSIREFAEIFEISVNHAEAVLKHRTVPSLELAVKIARYFEVTVDELFAWRFDDNGARRPLILEIKGRIVKGYEASRLKTMNAVKGS